MCLTSRNEKSGILSRTFFDKEDGSMDHPQIQSAVPSPARPAAASGDCIYQFAIILAALLLIVTAALI